MSALPANSLRPLSARKSPTVAGRRQRRHMSRNSLSRRIVKRAAVLDAPLSGRGNQIWGSGEIAEFPKCTTVINYVPGDEDMDANANFVVRNHPATLRIVVLKI